MKFQNQKGISSLLIVFMLSMIIIISLATTQLYVRNRARVHAQIRLAYKYTFIMEDVAKTVLDGHMRYANNGNNCTLPSVAQIVGTGAQITTICVGSSAGNRCVNSMACICKQGEADAACATGASLDRDFSNVAQHKENWKGKGLKLFQGLENQAGAWVASAVDWGLGREPLFPQALAALGSITITAPNAGASLTPNTTSQAKTTHTCSTVNQCIELKVCVPRPGFSGSVTGDIDVSFLGTDYICFHQRITRSVLDPGTPF